MFIFLKDAIDTKQAFPKLENTLSEGCDKFLN